MKIALVVTCVVPLLGCTGGTNEQTGGLMGAGGGALFGGLLGNQLGHNSASGTILGAGLGGLAGYFVGTAIGRQLDTQDRQRAADTTIAAVKSNSTRTWKSDHSGNSGKVVVHNVPKENGGECRSVHEIAYIKGQEVTQDQKYCRNGAGEWVEA